MELSRALIINKLEAIDTIDREPILNVAVKMVCS